MTVMPFIIPKGSIAIDGISLTVAEVAENRVTVALIPETLRVTNMGVSKVGDQVNIEVDQIAKYIEKLLKKHNIQEKVIFYGIEDISTMNPIWRVFSVIKKLTPNFVQFNKLPASKLQGVVTRVEM